MDLKVKLAVYLYRWQQSQGIFGMLISALTFAGVWTLLLGPIFSRIFGPGFGYSETLLLLIALVVVVFIVFGTFLDRGIRFWAAQAYVGTTRNPWLYDKLYQKEALNMVFRDIVELKTLLKIAERLELGEDTVARLNQSIMRLEEAARNKRWTVKPEEEAY